MAALCCPPCPFVTPTIPAVIGGTKISSIGDVFCCVSSIADIFLSHTAEDADRQNANGQIAVATRRINEMTIFKGINNPTAYAMLRLILTQQSIINRLVRQGGSL